MGHNTKKVYITNNTGQTVNNLFFEHRYDNDVKNPG